MDKQPLEAQAAGIIDFRSLLPQLTLGEKVSLLSGRDFVSTLGIPRLGIPPLKFADSINGVRPSQFDGTATTACFPSTTCIASTWDTELLGRLGEHLARQARLKSAQIILGPTINIHRDPRGGRNFECFSEDPLLTGELGAAIVNGIQKEGVGACVKHFVCNDSETLRHEYDVRESIDGRTLREIYLAAWEILLRRANPVAIMAAYNKVDGQYCSANYRLLLGILRDTWGYQGAVMSDWFGTQTTSDAIKAGLDLEMPLPIFRGEKLVKAVEGGQISVKEIDERVGNMLGLRNRTRSCHAEGPEQCETYEDTNELARELAASGIVLLKNEEHVLPVKPTGTSRKVALIGEFAQHPVVTGGGSASCRPQYKTIPIEALRSTLPSHEIRYARGVRTNIIVPVAPPKRLLRDDGERGVSVTYYNQDSEDPVLTEFQEIPSVWMLGDLKPGLDALGSRLEMTTDLLPETSGEHTLAVRCTGAFSLFVDGVEILSGLEPAITTEQFLFCPVLLESRVTFPMTAGRNYNIRLEMSARERLMVGEPTPYGATLCFEEYFFEEESICEAVGLALNSDISIIYAGRNEEYESEGFDLEHTSMPENQTRLIQAVAAASNKTVLILHCGNPIDVSPFIDTVDAVLIAHFPGQEGATAIADVLSGVANPSGRLATTWFKTLEDAPSYGHFPAVAPLTGEGGPGIRYGEGLEVGYRCRDMEKRTRWPFGFGLSYTTFAYRDLQVEVVGQDASRTLRCSVVVENTGPLSGMEVVQLFVSPPVNSPVLRPERELKAFTKVILGVGESRTVGLEVTVHLACRHWDERESGWKVEMGDYSVQIGSCLGRLAVTEE